MKTTNMGNISYYWIVLVAAVVIGLLDFSSAQKTVDKLKEQYNEARFKVSTDANRVSNEDAVILETRIGIHYQISNQFIKELDSKVHKSIILPKLVTRKEKLENNYDGLDYDILEIYNVKSYQNFMQFYKDQSKEQKLELLKEYGKYFYSLVGYIDLQSPYDVINCLYFDVETNQFSLLYGLSCSLSGYDWKKASEGMYKTPIQFLVKEIIEQSDISNDIFLNEDASNRSRFDVCLPYYENPDKNKMMSDIYKSSIGALSPIIECLQEYFAIQNSVNNYLLTTKLIKLITCNNDYRILNTIFDHPQPKMLNKELLTQIGYKAASVNLTDFPRDKNDFPIIFSSVNHRSRLYNISEMHNILMDQDIFLLPTLYVTLRKAISSQFYYPNKSHSEKSIYYYSNNKVDIQKAFSFLSSKIIPAARIKENLTLLEKFFKMVYVLAQLETKKMYMVPQYAVVSNDNTILIVPEFYNNLSDRKLSTIYLELKSNLLQNDDNKMYFINFEEDFLLYLDKGAYNKASANVGNIFLQFIEVIRNIAKAKENNVSDLNIKQVDNTVDEANEPHIDDSVNESNESQIDDSVNGSNESKIDDNVNESNKQHLNENITEANIQTMDKIIPFTSYRKNLEKNIKSIYSFVNDDRIISFTKSNDESTVLSAYDTCWKEYSKFNKKKRFPYGLPFTNNIVMLNTTIFLPDIDTLKTLIGSKSTIRTAHIIPLKVYFNTSDNMALNSKEGNELYNVVEIFDLGGYISLKDYIKFANDKERETVAIEAISFVRNLWKYRIITRNIEECIYINKVTNNFEWLFSIGCTRSKKKTLNFDDEAGTIYLIEMIVRNILLHTNTYDEDKFNKSTINKMGNCKMFNPNSPTISKILNDYDANIHDMSIILKCLTELNNSHYLKSLYLLSQGERSYLSSVVPVKKDNIYKVPSLSEYKFYDTVQSFSTHKSEFYNEERKTDFTILKNTARSQLLTTLSILDNSGLLKNQNVFLLPQSIVSRDSKSLYKYYIPDNYNLVPFGIQPTYSLEYAFKRNPNQSNRDDSFKYYFKLFKKFIEMIKIMADFEIHNVKFSPSQAIITNDGDIYVIPMPGENVVYLSQIYTYLKMKLLLLNSNEKKEYFVLTNLEKHILNSLNNQQYVTAVSYINTLSVASDHEIAFKLLELVPSQKTTSLIKETSKSYNLHEEDTGKGIGMQYSFNNVINSDIDKKVSEFRTENKVLDILNAIKKYATEEKSIDGDSYSNRVPDDVGCTIDDINKMECDFKFGSDDLDQLLYQGDENTIDFDDEPSSNEFDHLLYEDVNYENLGSLPNLGSGAKDLQVDDIIDFSNNEPVQDFTQNLFEQYNVESIDENKTKIDITENNIEDLINDYGINNRASELENYTNNSLLELLKETDVDFDEIEVNLNDADELFNDIQLETDSILDYDLAYMNRNDNLNEADIENESMFSNDIDRFTLNSNVDFLSDDFDSFLTNLKETEEIPQEHYDESIEYNDDILFNNKHHKFIPRKVNDYCFSEDLECDLPRKKRRLET